MRKDQSIIVHPNFKRLIKAGASLSGQNIHDFTQELSADEEVITKYLKKNLLSSEKIRTIPPVRRTKFDFKI